MLTVTCMDIDGFWIFLERSARETTNPQERIQWLEYRLSRISRTHVEDFQVNLNIARRPIDTYAMWGAANLIMDGLCSGDSFWYFQPWLIGLGRHWHELAASNPDNLADIPRSARWPTGDQASGPARSGRGGKNSPISPIASMSASPARKTASMTRWPHAASAIPPTPNLLTAPGTSTASPKSSDACHGSRACSHASDISRPEQLAPTESASLSQPAWSRHG